MIKEIIALKRLKKKGFGEKSLFDMLLGFRDSGLEKISDFLSVNGEKYNFTSEEVGVISGRSYEVEKIIDICNSKGIRIASLLDNDFPVSLMGPRLLPVLFCMGDLSILNSRNISIVGTRSPSSYGIDVTERLSEIISGSANIVSGGALGIDTVAHTSALKYNGKTIAFLGTTIDNLYPPVNIELFKRIVENGGLIISAFGPLEETNEFSFVKRNQYIAAVSQAVIIVEGGEKSGARLTAGYAMDLNIPVYAVPGPMTSEKSYTPNLLISKGARILYSFGQIEEFLGLAGKVADERFPGDGLPALDEKESEIFEIIGNAKEIHIDDISSRAGKSAGELSEILLNMELRGIIEQLPGKIFRKRSY